MLLGLATPKGGQLAPGTYSVDFGPSVDTQEWTVPPGITELLLEAWGAGGGGGAWNGDVASAGGGGGGGYANELAASVSPGEVIFILVPFGGLGGTSLNSDGMISDPGFVTIITDSSEVDSVCGSGGTSAGVGGTGGFGAGADVNHDGGDGYGAPAGGPKGGGGGGGAGSFADGGDGGAPPGGDDGGPGGVGSLVGGGGGGNGAGSVDPSGNGTDYGGGGGGGSEEGGLAGGNGADGHVRITFTVT